MKIALVYQAGIANVFDVDHFDLKDADRRNAGRLLQREFYGCEMFAKGAAAAGATVRTFACNRAGDITEAEWTDDLSEQPFREKFNPVNKN